jgi:hypothetical protein
MNTPTDIELLAWAISLTPSANQVAALEKLIAEWGEKKGSLNDPYDEEICDFHVECLRAQIEVTNCELAVTSALKKKEPHLFRDLSVKYSGLLDAVCSQRGRIYNVEQADRLIGKRPLKL